MIHKEHIGRIRSDDIYVLYQFVAGVASSHLTYNDTTFPDGVRKGRQVVQ